MFSCIAETRFLYYRQISAIQKMENGITETNNDNTNKQKGGRPSRKNKADPWSVRVDTETRQIITQTASRENKTLEASFGTTLREAIPSNNTLSEPTVFQPEHQQSELYR